MHWSGESLPILQGQRLHITHASISSRADGCISSVGRAAMPHGWMASPTTTTGPPLPYHSLAPYPKSPPRRRCRMHYESQQAGILLGAYSPLGILIPARGEKAGMDEIGREMGGFVVVSLMRWGDLGWAGTWGGLSERRASSDRCAVSSPHDKNCQVRPLWIVMSCFASRGVLGSARANAGLRSRALDKSACISWAGLPTAGCSSPSASPFRLAFPPRLSASPFRLAFPPL
ncbi:hypothetical protein BU26DRAFT_120181 [Trematosphaeria pertusa]|uniref:Uncharacterized protein n=1 Tax=Trematosphaeria pertusa TaxID=390896 RepID=A0A6A6HZ17_9PLEO|nr:uncharacterized protein BU26DRAFT_120181 [Trematosphaeria pertusa]KAF2242863.1 hypothetical protein BU26DRAFT_120181 [Trematosphaeria pertusa]